MNKPLTFRCKGHPNVRGEHDSTIEFTPDSELTRRGTCIVGVSTVCDTVSLTGLSGPLEIVLRVGDLTEVVHAEANPLFGPDDPLIIRKSPRRQARTFAMSADKSAVELSREMIQALQSTKAELVVTIARLTPEKPLGSGVLILEPGRSNPNEVDTVLKRLVQGERVSLKYDATGSNEKERAVIRSAIEGGAALVTLFGHDHIGAALAASGFSAEEYVFAGTIPKAAKARRAKIRELKTQLRTSVIAAPGASFDPILDEINEGAICLGLDIGTASATFFHGTVDEVRKGTVGLIRRDSDLVFVLQGRPENGDAVPPWLADLVKALLAENFATAGIARAIRDTLGWSRNRAYDFVQEISRDDRG
jgi:hypothetical protein